VLEIDLRLSWGWRRPIRTWVRRRDRKRNKQNSAHTFCSHFEREIVKERERRRGRERKGNKKSFK
jgi:hypothetical protein